MTTFRSWHDGLPLIGFAWWAEDLGPMWTRSDLGLTNKQVETLLGKPDAYGRNPRGGAYVLLFRRDRVAEVFERNGWRLPQDARIPPLVVRNDQLDQLLRDHKK